MAVNERNLALGRSRSAIREVAAVAAVRAADPGSGETYDFSLGNPSVPAPDEVHASIERALLLPSRELHGYTPAAGLPEAREAVAASLRRQFGPGAATAGDLFLTCGAAASVCCALHALCAPGDEVLLVVPCFPEYRVWVESAGARCVEVSADPVTFQLDLDAVAAALTPRTRVVVVDSPNNPTGVVYSRRDLESLSALLDGAEARWGRPVTLLSDEPYRQLSYGAEVPWVPSVRPRSVVCTSCSKSLSLPGERIGWLLVPPDSPEHDELLAAVAGAARALGFVCAPSLFQRVLADCADVSCDVAAYDANRRLLCDGLRELGYGFVEPQGAFYLWVRSLEPDEGAFFSRASRLGLLPVPSTSFGCPGWVRASYCVPADVIRRSMPAWAALAESYRTRG